MRAFLPVALGAALTVGAMAVAAAGCTAGSSLPLGEGGVTDGSSSDGSGADGAATDSALADSGNGGNACPGKGGYDKTCTTLADCDTVSLGCYCGAQPVIGVAKTARQAAQACEEQAAAQCALGCPNFPGQVTEDGTNLDGGAAQALCDNGKCHTVPY